MFGTLYHELTYLGSHKEKHYEHILDKVIVTEEGLDNSYFKITKRRIKEKRERIERKGTRGAVFKTMKILF